MAYPVVVSSLTGLALGDLMVGVCSADNFTGSGTPPAIALPSGFTLIRDNAPINYKEIMIGWKYADAGDVSSPGSISFSVNNGASSGSISSQTICRITGMKATGFPNAIASADSTTTAAITPTTQCLFLMIGGSAGPGGGSVITASGYQIASNNPSWTELVDTGALGVGASNKTSVFIAWANQTAAGGVSTGAGSVSLTGGTVQMLALIAIDPAPITVSIFGNNPSAIIQPTYVRKMVQTIISTTSAIIAPTSSGEIINKWNNLVKSATSVFRNLNKS